MEQGVLDSDELAFRRHWTGLDNNQLRDAAKYRKFGVSKAIVGAGILIWSFSAFIQSKNRNRFK